ncbi:MAG TPA: multicopper oxidase domain-containing protein [Vicinamibacterales bacterium]|nr:multicopper oxidase domain-containing protein [Vicinamibacterales bacterium]
MLRKTHVPTLGTTRRDFIRIGAAAGGGLFLSARFGGTRYVSAGTVPGGMLDPTGISKYATPLLVPPVMPRAGIIPTPGGKPVDYYEISMRQFSQQILPSDLPATTVWGYGAVSSSNRRGLLIHNAPSLTIEAMWNRPVRVKWINELVDAQGSYLPHLLPVDQTLHWANPPGGTAGRDSRPSFDGMGTPGSYTGPVPIVTHVHGAVGVGDESDGYAEAWYLPNANDIPNGYAREGTWYDFFKGKAAAGFGASWGPGYAVFQYPNANRASTIWYHDHALGMTRLNVYAGPAGFYIVRGGPAGDKAVLDSRTGGPAVLPGPAPREGDRFPPNKAYHEIPVAIQDRSFRYDGSLFYPDTRAFFDEFAGPFIPDTDVSPIWNPEFFGNCMMVNGNTWPFLDVEQRRYRFRFLNGCQSRFLILDFGSIPGVEVWQIGNEGGFLPAPVNITENQNNRLLMGLAERADLIVDFTNVQQDWYVLRNVGPDEPFGGGVPAEDFDPADDESTGQIMQFRVGPPRSVDVTTPPAFLQLPAITPLPAADRTRRLALLEEMSQVTDGPAAAVLGTIGSDDRPEHRMWADPVTENPAVGETEVWEFYNLTEDAHPMHVHEVVFEVVNRQALKIEEPDEHEAHPPVELDGEPRDPEPTELGLKDTVTAYPGEVTRIRARFDTPGQFVWHCHIVEHEDNEMMRPYRVGPEQPGQPTGK